VVISLRCLIFGGSGLVGSEVARLMTREAQVHYTYYRNNLSINDTTGHQLAITDFPKVSSLIAEVRPDIIFHAASNPSVDWHEGNVQEAYETNVVAAKNIAEASAKTGAKLVYVSTAAVFPPGKKQYTEDDLPAPINYYGVTKLGAELAVTRNKNHVIARTDQIYGWSGGSSKKSFVENVLGKLRNCQSAEVCGDWYNCPTYSRDLAAVLVRLSLGQGTGIYHAVGSSYINRYEWGLRIAKIFGYEPLLVKSILSQSLGLPARRSNANLSNLKVQNELNMKMKTVDEGINAMKNEMVV
jgi:dTDP-4-dehydrorhamnose reductase